MIPAFLTLISTYIVVLVDAPQLSSSGSRPDYCDSNFERAIRCSPVDSWFGGPDNAALLAWMGVDLFDSSRPDWRLVMDIYSPC